MQQSASRTLMAVALVAICLIVWAYTPVAQQPQTKPNKDLSDASDERPLYSSELAQKHSAGLSGLNIRGSSPAQKEACPPAGFDANAQNLLRNASFEGVGPRGRTASFSGRPGADDARSAAADWTMHTSNDRANVTTELIKSTKPGGGKSMLHVSAGSNEGGVYQAFAADNRGPARVVASAWVFVKRGRVVIGTGNSGFITNSALSTTTGKWELLQACSDGDAAKTDFRRCMREHGATPRELAPNELTANVTGTATLETENRDARGPFDADLDMDVRFSRNRCNVTITRFPSISVERRIRGQNVTITVTKTGGGSGSFHPVSGRMNIPIRLHFRYSHPLAPDDDANFSLSTDDSITRNNGDVVTGSPVNAEGDIRLVGAGRFRNGVLSPSDGTLVIRANIPPRQ